MEVAKLTADINVKIPFDQIKKFDDELNKILTTLDHIVDQLDDMSSAAKRATKAATQGQRKRSKGNKKQVKENEKLISQEKEKTKETKKTNRNMGRTAKVFGGLANMIARVRVGLGLLKFAFNAVAKLVLIPAGTLAAVTTLGAKISSVITEQFNLSRAVGMNINDLRALGLAAKEFGFTFEHVNSIVEELNNKLGGERSGFQEGNLREGLAALNLEVETLLDLSPEASLEAIMEAGRELSKDSKNLNKVASAYDKIFGLEANRLLGGFNQKMLDNNQNWSDFVKHYKGFTKLTDKAVKGSLKFTSIWNKFWAAAGAASAKFFGGVGEKLGKLEDSLSNTFRDLFSSTGSVSEMLQDLIVKSLLYIIALLVEVRNWVEENEESIKDWGKSAGDSFDWVADKIKWVINNFEKFTWIVSAVAGLAIGIFILLGSKIAIVGVIIWSVIRTLQALWAAIRLVGEVFLAFFREVQFRIKYAVKLLEDLFIAGFKDGILGVLNFIGGRFTKFFDGLIAKYKKVRKALGLDKEEGGLAKGVQFSKEIEAIYKPVIHTAEDLALTNKKAMIAPSGSGPLYSSGTVNGVSNDSSKNNSDNINYITNQITVEDKESAEEVLKLMNGEAPQGTP